MILVETTHKKGKTKKEILSDNEPINILNFDFHFKKKLAEGDMCKIYFYFQLSKKIQKMKKL